MGGDATEGGFEPLSPETAFSILGNETRLEILHTLLTAEQPLTFSELRDAVGIRDSGQFNYHLDKLLDHFVTKSQDHYELRQVGRRVLESVLSGTFTRDPILEPTTIEEPCPVCGGPTMVAYYQERVEHYCPSCPGRYDPAEATSEIPRGGTGSGVGDQLGYLGSVALPPAGVSGRTPEELYRVSTTWGNVELLTVASDVCPRCSASLECSRQICDAHEATDGRCAACGNQHAVLVSYRCPNCHFEQGGSAVLALLADLDVLAFLVAHGLNPITPASPAAKEAALMGYDEDVLSKDPFEARFTFTIDDESLVLTVDDDLTVVESSIH